MKILYLTLGFICLGLGAAGIVMPFVPTTPLVLLAALFFGKSSKRLHTWFIATRFYKRNIEGFVKERAMTVCAKLKLLVTITIFMGLSFYIMRITQAPYVAQTILAVVWAAHVLYFGLVVRTVEGK